MRQLAYAIIINNHALFHLWWKENLVKNEKVSKYCDYFYSNISKETTKDTFYVNWKNEFAIFTTKFYI